MRSLIAIVAMVLCCGAAHADEVPLSPDDVRKQAIDLLSAGQQSDAEKLVFAKTKENPDVKLIYLTAVLVRTRFEVNAADKIFDLVKAQQPESLEGKVAGLVAAIDRRKDTEDNFQALDQLATANPKDPLVLWMVCVECRQLKKAKVGIDRYNTLLTMLNPGPSLLHQTLGNLLMDDRHPDLALKQYDIAIQLEPAAWDYNCRGNALSMMFSYDAADAAYRKATELDPNYALAWNNWAMLCDSRGDTAGAAEKRKKLAEIQQRSGN